MNERKEGKSQEDEQQKAKKPSFAIADRRHWVARETAEGEAPPTEKPRLPTYLEQLRIQLDEKDRKLREYIDKVDRENADFRERLNREFDRRVKKARAELILEFLPVIDNLERAIASAEEHGTSDNLLEGIKIVRSQFMGQLKKEGVEQVEVVGEPFDPSVSEALQVAPTENPEEDNLVVGELEKGYTLNGKLLRPAKVLVSRLAPEKDQDKGE